MKLTTTVYKYKRAAPWMLVLLVLATFFVFFLAVYWASRCWYFCIVAVLRPKSILSVRSVDDRKLVFTTKMLIWGTVQMPVVEVEKLEIYIYAFDAFKHHGEDARIGKAVVTEYGDKNTIAFVYRDVKYDLTFYLGTFEHYDTLVKIIKHWQKDGINLSARSAFTDSFIRKQVNLYGGGAARV